MPGKRQGRVGPRLVRLYEKLVGLSLYACKGIALLSKTLGSSYQHQLPKHQSFNAWLSKQSSPLEAPVLLQSTLKNHSCAS